MRPEYANGSIASTLSFSEQTAILHAHETNCQNTLKFNGKELLTVEDVRAALNAIIEDIQSGDATVTKAKPIQKEIKTRLKEIRAQMKSVKPEHKAALKSFFVK
jgi:tRNA(Ser,Leu) C12 N-acetylase TAN1